MVPEGLEWKSVDEILDQVQSVGFNFIRLTYAIEAIDQVYARNMSDVPLEVAMINALGYENGTRVTRQIVEKNPSWSKDTGRFQIWDDIATSAAARHIFIHPDVHVGTQAKWCCNNTDGNAWFDDAHFPVANWHRGLRFVASWARSHSNVVSMALRNELRRAVNVSAPTSTLTYNWVTLVGNHTAATDQIHAVNPDILVSWSGLQYDQDLSALTSGANLHTAPCYKCDAIRDAPRRPPRVFDLAAHPWSDKVFYELHLYSMSEDLDTDSCPIIRAELYRAGFHALGIPAPAACASLAAGCVAPVRHTPVMLSEFGWAQDASLLDDTLQGCLREFTTEYRVSWAVWSLAGSYRVREGGQGVDDTWGLTTFDWAGWRFEEGVQKWWKPWVQAMLG
jgi:hypothetical protein